MTVMTTHPPSTGAAASSRWVALALICLCSLMIVLDSTVVNVALPAIQSDLGFSAAGLAWGSSAIVAGSLLVLVCNHALSGTWGWTPGGSAVAFGRMLQDGIVKRYLDDNCDRVKLKLCPYRNELPPTGDDFLWGGNNNVFDRLGRFEGLSNEMDFIAHEALIAYPWMQAKTAAKATWDQLVHVATGEGTTGIPPLHAPAKSPCSMRCFARTCSGYATSCGAATAGGMGAGCGWKEGRGEH